MKKQGLFGVMTLLAALSCDNGTDLASDESGGGTKAGAGGTKASGGGTSAGKDGGGEQSGSGSAGLAGAQTGGSSGHGGASAGAGGADEPPPCPTDLSSAQGQDCSAYEEGTECSDGQTDPCQFGNSIICSTGKWQRRETIPAPCGGAGGGGSSDGMLGEVCVPNENSCGQGLACCYPCGVEGCDFVCEPRCAAGSAGCIDGCVPKP
jgi:hypothetical protein